jgi:hypothetical protein
MYRFIPVVVLAASFSGNAAAGTREDVLSGAVRCGGITDDRKWLDCFYGSAQPMRSQLGLPPAPPSQTVLVPVVPASPGPPAATAPVATPQRATRGFWDRMLGGQVILAATQVSNYSFDGRGLFTITLANGEIWRQQDDTQLARWKKPPTHYLVTITKGALNSYNLTITDESYIYKVWRLR